MKRIWRTPRVVSLQALPLALGDCMGGASETGECGCHNGGDTGLRYDPPTDPRPMEYFHGCESGGIPSDCFCGETAGPPSGAG
jgi:hypothetical protein